MEHLPDYFPGLDEKEEFPFKGTIIFQKARVGPWFRRTTKHWIELELDQDEVQEFNAEHCGTNKEVPTSVVLEASDPDKFLFPHGTRVIATFGKASVIRQMYCAGALAVRQIRKAA